MNAYRVENKTESRLCGCNVTTCSLFESTGGAFECIWTGAVSGWDLTENQLIEKAHNEYLKADFLSIFNR